MKLNIQQNNVNVEYALVKSAGIERSCGRETAFPYACSFYELQRCGE